MTELTLARVEEHCQRLGLPHLQAALGEALSRAEAEGWGQVQLLDRLLETELAAREERRIRTGLKLAAFPFVKTLDAFDFAFQPSLERARVMDLAALGFVARKENVLLLGPPGVGKTHLAIALAVRACQMGASVYFTSLDAMIRALREADGAGRLTQKLKTYTTKSQLLVVDEVGYLPLGPARSQLLLPGGDGALRAVESDPDLQQGGHRVAGPARRGSGVGDGDFGSDTASRARALDQGQ